MGALVTNSFLLFRGNGVVFVDFGMLNFLLFFSFPGTGRMLARAFGRKHINASY